MYYLETSVLGFASLLILLIALLLGMLLYKGCMENGSEISVEGTQYPGQIHLKRRKFKESNKEGAIFITVN